MKTLFRKITLLISILYLSVGFAIPTFAGSVSISSDRSTVVQGEIFSVYVTIYGNDIYNAYIDVSCDDIFLGGTTDIVMSDGGSSISAEIKITAIGIGTGNIYVGGYTDEDEDIWLTDSCVVTVTPGSESGNDVARRGANAGTDYGYDNGTYINNNPTRVGSGNAAVSYIRLFGPDNKEFSLKNEDNGTFSSSVSGIVDKITIDVGTEDLKATVSGAGEKKLRFGMNTFEVVITAENGLQMGYQINITRKDDRIALCDLEAEMTVSKESFLTVILQDGDILNATLLKAVKAWGKTLYLNRYDEADMMVYGWTIKGANIMDDMKSFDPAVTFDSNSKDKIGKLSNFAIGKILNPAYSGKLPEGTLLTLRNKAEFKEGTILYLYNYNKTTESLMLQEQGIRATKETVVLQPGYASEYFLTGAVLPQTVKNYVSGEWNTKNKALWSVVVGVVSIVFFTAALVVVRIRNKNKMMEKLKKAAAEPRIRKTVDIESELKDE